MRIDHPLEVGDELDIIISHVDVPKGEYKFVEASRLQSMSSASQSLDDIDVDLDLVEEEAEHAPDAADSETFAQSSVH